MIRRFRTQWPGRRRREVEDRHCSDGARDGYRAIGTDGMVCPTLLRTCASTRGPATIPARVKWTCRDQRRPAACRQLPFENPELATDVLNREAALTAIVLEIDHLQVRHFAIPYADTDLIEPQVPRMLTRVRGENFAVTF